MCNGGLFSSGIAIRRQSGYALDAMTPLRTPRLLMRFVLFTVSAVETGLTARADIPPLTEQQLIALETADDDDRDWRESAFEALVSNARQWRPPLDEWREAQPPDLDELLARPELYRGAIYVLSGRLELQTRLPDPNDDVLEWFVRDEAGRPMQVYVIDPAIALPGLELREGGRVRILARFYKRMTEQDRTGTTRRYPAFIGAIPQPVVPVAGESLATLWFVAALLAVLLVIFAALFIYVRQSRRSRGRSSRLAASESVTVAHEQPPLPDDPADALAELRRRALSSDD